MIKALNEIKESVGWNSVLPLLSAALVPDAPHLRQELFHYLNQQLQSDSSKVLDGRVLLPACCLALQDRSGEVRKSAQGFLLTLANKVGTEAILSSSPVATHSLLLPQLKSMKVNEASVENINTTETATIESVSVESISSESSKQPEAIKPRLVEEPSRQRQVEESPKKMTKTEKIERVESIFLNADGRSKEKRSDQVNASNLRIYFSGQGLE